MGDHSLRLTPHREGTHARAMRLIDGDDGLVQELVGRPIDEGDTVEGAPMHEMAEILDQAVGGQHLAHPVEHQRRQTECSQGLAGDAGALELQAGGHQGTAGKVGAQRVETIDQGALGRPLGEPAREQQQQHFPGRQFHRGHDHRADAGGTPEIPIERLLLELHLRHDVPLGDEARSRGRQHPVQPMAALRETTGQRRLGPLPGAG